MENSKQKIITNQSTDDFKQSIPFIFERVADIQVDNSDIKLINWSIKMNST